MDGRARIAWNLRRFRSGLGLTQEILAMDAGVAAPYLSRIEREQANPTIDVLERIANVLKIDVNELLVKPEKGSARPKALRAGRKPRRSSQARKR
jgi:transcriptional regulator with XRE-family HTH domain